VGWRAVSQGVVGIGTFILFWRIERVGTERLFVVGELIPPIQRMDCTIFSHNIDAKNMRRPLCPFEAGRMLVEFGNARQPGVNLGLGRRQWSFLETLRKIYRSGWLLSSRRSSTRNTDYLENPSCSSELGLDRNVKGFSVLTRLPRRPSYLVYPRIGNNGVRSPFTPGTV